MRNENPLDYLIRKLELHHALSQDDRDAIFALPYRLRSLDPSTYIVREGDQPHICSVLCSGFAFRQKLTGEGARQIISLHIPGEALDFQNLYLGVSDHNVQMLTRGTVADVPMAAFRELTEARGSIRHAILVTMLADASIYREWVLNVGRRNARTRIAHVLCEFAVRMEAHGLDRDHGYELPMTQEQLADATGLTAVHVNRVLKSLDSDGLIVRHRRNISFPDWRRLREEADFNERYLHLKRELEPVG